MPDFTCSGVKFSASKKPWNMLRVQNLTRKLSNLLIFHHVSTLSSLKTNPESHFRRLASRLSETNSMNPHKLLGQLMADQDETFKLVSPSFDHGDRLPRKYTNGGQGALKDLSPPLEWYNVPDGTQSLALVVEDVDATAEPDGPAVPWTHWVVANIPPSVKRLPEGFSNKEKSLGHEYEPIKEGYNDWKVPGWCGPVHQSSDHRIVYRLYALDDMMHLGTKVTKEKLLEAIDGHVLAEAELMAVF